jgi:two-component system, LytTR family, sensor kinase
MGSRDMNLTSGNRRIARELAILATALALWGVLVLLFAAPLAFTSRMTLRQAVSFGVSFWAPWVLFLPAVAWLAFNFPIERKRLFRVFFLHLVGSFLVVTSSWAVFRAADRILPLTQRSVPLGPPGFRAALDVLVYWSLVGACQAITNFRSSQERDRRAAELEARLASARLQALRMQINPHFLFNTLNSIAALIYVNPRAADEMLGDLSLLLRRSLDSMDEHEVALAQELEFMGTYLNIEQRRFGERLQVQLSVPHELMKAMVPALILQPLVENAIRHGIEPQRGPGVIKIEAKQEGEQLRLLVCDNGKGLPETKGKDSSAGCGIGLANTKARLHALYGARQSFSFGKAEQGCRVEVCLPLHFNSFKPAA